MFSVAHLISSETQHSRSAFNSPVECLMLIYVYSGAHNDRDAHSPFSFARILLLHTYLLHITKPIIRLMPVHRQESVPVLKIFDVFTNSL